MWGWLTQLQTNFCCRSDSVVQEIALGGLEKEDEELNQLDRALFSKVDYLLKSVVAVGASEC